MGDVNCDGAVDALDALFILRAVAGLPTATCGGQGDVDCSGWMDAVDALSILRYGAGLPPVAAPAPCPLLGSRL